MDTYGDLVTLLLCFFVLLYSFSSLDASKWKAFISSFKGGAGMLDGQENYLAVVTNSPEKEINLSHPGALSGVTPGITIAMPSVTKGAITPIPTKVPVKTITKPVPSLVPKPTVTKPVPTPSALYTLYKKLDTKLSGSPSVYGVEIEKEGDEVRIRLIASVLFEPGTDRLNDNAYGILKEISLIVKEYAAGIKDFHTEGHTDDATPPEGGIENKFDLAGRRAAKVLQYLIEKCSVDPLKAYTIGFGSSRPVAPNDTVEGRDKNNRVDIVMID